MRLRTIIALIMTISMCRVILQCSYLWSGLVNISYFKTGVIISNECSQDPWVSEGLYLISANMEKFSPQLATISTPLKINNSVYPEITRTVRRASSCLHKQFTERESHSSPHKIQRRTNPMFLNLLHTIITIMFMSRKASKIENKDLLKFYKDV